MESSGSAPRWPGPAWSCWPRTTSRGAPRSANAGVGVTGARAGIAATGTLLLPCGPGRPRGTHIVPPAHVCLVRAMDLVATIEDAILLQAREPHPSTMSWVSGPSRTADLEMRQTIGVHGPKSVE